MFIITRVLYRRVGRAMSISESKEESVLLLIFQEQGKLPEILITRTFSRSMDRDDRIDYAQICTVTWGNVSVQNLLLGRASVRNTELKLKGASNICKLSTLLDRVLETKNR